MKSRKHLEACLLSTNAYEMLFIGIIISDPLRINKPLRKNLRIRECKYQGFTPTNTGEKNQIKMNMTAVILELSVMIVSNYF